MALEETDNPNSAPANSGQGDDTSSKPSNENGNVRSPEEVWTDLVAMGYDPCAKKNGMGIDYVETAHHDTYDFIDPKQWDLKGRTVFITGASKGLGKAFAISYAKAGVSNIGIGARSPLEDVEKDIYEAAKSAGRPEPKVLALKLDVVNKESVVEAAKETEKAFGGIDILINNSGFMEENVQMTDVNTDQWWQVFEVNILGTFLTTRTFMSLLLSNENSLKTVVNLTSIWGLTTWANCSAYQISKSAIMRFSQLLNVEYGSKGLLSYHLHPGGIKTELASNMPAEIRQFLIDTPELAGDTLVWLTAERREWLAGRYLTAQWDMKEVLEKREKIVDEDHLKMRMSVGRD